MLEELKQQVYEANMALPELGLVVFTWGNASGFDRERGLFAIKPSGVEYGELTPEAMVICDLDGNVVEGDLRPSSDTPTHAAIYRAWGDRVGGCSAHALRRGRRLGAGRALDSLPRDDAC